jgi:hypothetical protein
MKRVIALLFGVVASVSSGQKTQPAVSLQWAIMFSSYRRFEEIKPKLVNNSKSSIFLSRPWPNGSAHLERFNSDSGQWETGEWAITCGTVAQTTVPIEIKPNSRRKIYVYWQLSTDKWDNPQHFVIFQSRRQRALEGQYRFVLRYSLEPWTLVHHPSAINSITSPEFVLAE